MGRSDDAVPSSGTCKIVPVIGNHVSSRPDVVDAAAKADLKDVATTAALLDLSERYVWQLIASGSLKSIKHRGRRRVPTQAIRDYLEGVPNRVVYSVAEAAIVLDLPESELLDLVNTGEVASMSVESGGRLIPVDAVQKLRGAA